jgi:hypothetical protein
VAGLSTSGEVLPGERVYSSSPAIPSNPVNDELDTLGVMMLGVPPFM